MRNFIENLQIWLGLTFRPKRGSARDLYLTKMFREKMRRDMEKAIAEINLDTKDIKFITKE